MTLKQALDTIKSAIPIKAGDYYEELLSDMVNYVEVKTRGFSYEQGILDEPVDWDIYKVKPSELAKTVGKPDPTEKDIIVWLARELKANDLVKNVVSTQTDADKKRKLKLLKLKKKSAAAQLEILKIKVKH